jgi:hypothetical protein
VSIIDSAWPRHVGPPLAVLNVLSVGLEG